MNILLIAPSQTGSSVPRLETLPEIKSIIQAHKVTLLIGEVTIQQIYDAVRQNNFNILHFATHTVDRDKLWINENEILNKDELAQLARTASCDLVFLNACDSAGLASYLVRHGTKYAIYTTDVLIDRLAWQMPNTFYYLLTTLNDYVDAYVRSDSGEGLYGLVVTPERMIEDATLRKELDTILMNVRILYILEGISLAIFLIMYLTKQ